MYETPKPWSPPARRFQLICNHRGYKQFHSKTCSYTFICFHNGLPAGSETQTHSKLSVTPLFLVCSSFVLCGLSQVCMEFAQISFHCLIFCQPDNNKRLSDQRLSTPSSSINATSIFIQYHPGQSTLWLYSHFSVHSFTRRAEIMGDRGRMLVNG